MNRRASHWRWLPWLLLVLCPGMSLAVAPRPMTPVPQPRIANGLSSSLWPAVASLQFRQRAFHFCSGVLVDCRTVLTAAHCFCGASAGDDGAQCQPDNDAGIITSPGVVEVFFQHAPPARVKAVAIPPDYEFAVRADVALVTLAEPVGGVVSGVLNTVARPASGTTATLVGYGQSDQRVVDFGVKRVGEVRLSSCIPAGVPGDEHLCWDFPGLDGAGEPGTESNTCPGDSGGPLFVDSASGPLVAGITSGGINACHSPDTAFDADVYVNRAWLRSRIDTRDRLCGGLPAVGGDQVTVFASSGRLDLDIDEARYTFTVATDIQRLRVGLNGDDQMDLDLQVAPLGEPVQCLSQRQGVFEFCEIDHPRSGIWEVVVRNINGQTGEYQVVSSLFNEILLFRDGFDTP